MGGVMNLMKTQARVRKNHHLGKHVNTLSTGMFFFLFMILMDFKKNFVVWGYF